MDVGTEVAVEREQASQVRSVPRWVAPLFGVLATLTVPWIGYLALTLPRHAVAEHYREAWVGFDVGLVTALALTATQAYLGNRRVALAASATTTMLLVDAWFDVTTTPRGPDLVISVVLALLVEVPLAGLCLWIAWHSDRVVERRMQRLALRARLAAERAVRAENAVTAIREENARSGGRGEHPVTVFRRAAGRLRRTR